MTLPDPFGSARQRFEEVASELQGPKLLGVTESEVEEWLDVAGRDILRRLMQDHLRLRKIKEPVRPFVVGADGEVRKEAVQDKERGLATVFGEVDVGRVAFRAPRKGVGNLMPLDLDLNLPPSHFSFALQKRAAVEVARSSFMDARETLKDRTGVFIATKQLEDMVTEMARDFDMFYSFGSRTALAGLEAAFGSPNGILTPAGLDPSKFLVITVDGKGIAVIEEDLREDTRKEAKKRREKRERSDPMSKAKAVKLYRRRTAQVCAVYIIDRYPRMPEDLICEMRHLQPVKSNLAPRPKPEQKRVWASVERDAEVAIRQAFDEAMLRDPNGCSSQFAAETFSDSKELSRIWR